MPQELLIAVGVGLLTVVVAALILIRRRRAAQQDTLGLPEIGESIDYTSLPVEERKSLGERFRAAPPALKVLLVLAPLALIGVVAALALTFGPLTAPPPTPTPAPPPPTIAIQRAEVVGAGKIVVVVGTSNMPPGTTISAVLLDDAGEFAWFDPQTNAAQPDPISGVATLQLDRVAGAPVPSRAVQYRISALASGPAGELARTDPAPLTVLEVFEADFYQDQTGPTAVSILASPEATPEPETTPADTPTPQVEATAGLTATARIGGNIRQEPNRLAEVVGTIAVGDVVTLTERSVDGEWYRIERDGLAGWVSRTLLTVDPALASALPIVTPSNLPTAAVFNGGNLRSSPNLRGSVVDQVNAGESVQLLARSPDGAWLKVINAREITGWVSRSLLTVADDALAGLPESSEPVPTPLAATASALPPAPTAGPTPLPGAGGLTAIVFNGGNVRAAPDLQGQVLDQINARESVQLLTKTPDGEWYRITNERGVTGWVNRTLLTVDPDVARRVPVGQ